MAGYGHEPYERRRRMPEQQSGQQRRREADQPEGWHHNGDAPRSRDYEARQRQRSEPGWRYGEQLRGQRGERDWRYGDQRQAPRGGTDWRYDDPQRSHSGEPDWRYEELNPWQRDRKRSRRLPRWLASLIMLAVALGFGVALGAMFGN